MASTTVPPLKAAKKLAGKTLRQREVRWDKRFAWACAFALGVMSCVLYGMSATRLDVPPHGSGPQGDTATGYVLGVLTLIFYALVAFYSMRHRRRKQKAAQTRTWMEVHLAFGILSGVTAILHSGPRFFSAAPLHGAFLLAWVLLIATGVGGKLLSVWIPHRLTRIEDEALLVEDVVDRQSSMRKEIEDLLQANPDKVFVDFSNMVAPRAVLNPQHYGKRRLRRADVIEEVWTASKGATLLPAPQHDIGRRIVSCLVEERFLDQMQSYHYWLRAWLPLHVALTTLCFPWLIVHVVTVFLW
jgi:hypothetical protein